MICKNCNAFIDNNSIFCPSCGRKVESDPVTASASTFSSAFRPAGSLDGSDSGIGVPVVEKKPAAAQADGGLRFSSSYKREASSSSPYGSRSVHTEAPGAAAPVYNAPYNANMYGDVSNRSIPDQNINAPYTSAPQGTPPQQPAYYANSYNPYGQPYVVNNVTVSTAAPVGQLNTNKALWKYLLFSLLTFGIYPLVVMTSVSESVNIAASRYDGKKTMHYCLLFFLIAPLTLGIANFVWYHKVSNRIGGELRRRGVDYSFGASDYWLWNILGVLFIVGPFIYLHKLFKATNLMCENYNYYG